jgi:N-acyl-D-aspartate/D-glutamate deacylase
LTAEKFGLSRRGIIAEGYFADLVLLDAATINDAATFDDPAKPAEGIHAVLVNGVIVLNNGELRPERPGRVLRRQGEGC